MTVQAPQAILFDKDGTLFDFQASWGEFTHQFLHRVAEGDPVLFEVLADAVRYDPQTRTLFSDSTVIAGTTEASADLILPHLSDAPLRSVFIERMNEESAKAPMQPAVDLAPLLQTLLERGLQLGVATNDAEASARAQLEREGITSCFSYIKGYDSGYGAKPGTGQLLGFAEHAGLQPSRIAMVGDSTHDLLAGRAAGMVSVGVLTGPAREDDLAPIADAVLPDIGYLPGWLDTLEA